MKVRKIRLLRHKYGISRVELGAACGLSPQRISEIELGSAAVSYTTTARLLSGVLSVLNDRETAEAQLREDIHRHGDTLMELVEESEYEL